MKINSEDFHAWKKDRKVLYASGKSRGGNFKTFEVYLNGNILVQVSFLTQYFGVDTDEAIKIFNKF